MLRHGWLLLAVMACEPALQLRPLPELVAQTRPVPIAVPALRLIPGETMIWDIHMGSFTIARAELVVSEHDVRSQLKTGRLASSFAKVRYDLTTVIEPGGGWPGSAIEVLEVDGKTTSIAMAFDAAMHTVTVDRGGPHGPGSDDRPIVVPDGNIGHTVHSALGAIRAWAEPQARAGYLYVLVGGDLYRIDVAQPFIEDLQGTSTLRVECRVRAETPVSLTIWLRATADRMPVRFEISGEDRHLAAELIGS